MSPPKINEYVWAEIGSLLGAVVSFPVAAVVFVSVFLGVGFERLEDLTRTGIISFAAGTLVLIVGSALGCGFALRKAGYPLAREAARLHFLLLFVFLLAAVGFTSEHRDSIASEATLVPLVMPLLATWVTGLVPNNGRIETFVVLVLALGAYGVFSRASAVSLVLAELPPTVEEEVPAPSQLPLGMDNPCWAGIYPDDLGFLQAEELPVRDFLVDRTTNDIYHRDCVRDRVAEGSYWPSGVAARLVRSGDIPTSDYASDGRTGPT
ncbi:MAG TPA: hypothetical protein VFH75_03675 [Actinomycetota bacterium]|nr:hypothetical protein [Actinomycetota bacterium]